MTSYPIELKKRFGEENLTIALKVAPNDMERQAAITVLMKYNTDDRLKDCTANSILTCIRSLIATGINPDPIFKTYYMQPITAMQDGKQVKVAQLDLLVKGLEIMARDTGIKILNVNNVFQKDAWTRPKYENGKLEFSHTPAIELPDRGIFLFSYCEYIDLQGIYRIEILTAKEIESIKNLVRKKSRDGKSLTPAWDNFPEEMYKAKCLRRAAKHWSLSGKYKEVLENEFNIIEDAIETTATVVDSKPAPFPKTGKNRGWNAFNLGKQPPEPPVEETHEEIEAEVVSEPVIDKAPADEPRGDDVPVNNEPSEADEKNEIIESICSHPYRSQLPKSAMAKIAQEMGDTGFDGKEFDGHRLEHFDLKTLHKLFNYLEEWKKVIVKRSYEKEAKQ